MSSILLLIGYKPESGQDSIKTFLYFLRDIKLSLR